MVGGQQGESLGGSGGGAWSQSYEYTAAPAETGGRRYRTTDHLGSTRLVTNSAGAAVSRHDYVPFGEELQASSSAGNRNLVFGFGVSPSERHKFTGKERDTESGLDWFESRYFSSAQGRFTSPDVMMAKQEWLADPQRWSRYAYVRNNPLRYIDPNGEDLVVYTFYGSDLTEEQKKYLQANMKQVQANIAEKFKKAGVDKVEFRDGTKLTQKQINKILANERSTNTTGIGLLNFANEKFSGQKAGSMQGATATDSRSAVFMKNVGEGLDLSSAGGAGIMNFRLGEVGAHELGHGQRFESDGATWNFIRDLGGNPWFGFGNLMGEGQGVPRRTKQFDPSQDKTQRAIHEINRIGDNTPKP